MGPQCSKGSDFVSPLVPPRSNSNSNPQYLAELNSYIADCKRDPELQKFDSVVMVSTMQAVNTLASNVESNTLSLVSLREVTNSLADVSHEAVKVILEYKKDTWKNPEMRSFVEEYFNNSLHILEFCNVLAKCLRRARDSQLIIGVALQRYENETAREVPDKERYRKTLLELKRFKDLGNPFGEDFVRKFQDMYREQVELLKKMHLQKLKLDKKTKSLKSWITVSNVIFVSLLASVLIFSVVVASVAAPPVVAALVGTLTVPTGYMGNWINSLWKSCEMELMGELKVVDLMQRSTYVAVQDLENIRVQVDRLQIEIESLLENTGLALREEDAVKIVIDEIKRKVDLFSECLDNLTNQIAKCHHGIMDARAVVSKQIIKHQ